VPGLDTCIDAPVPGYLYQRTCAWIPVLLHLCLDTCINAPVPGYLYQRTCAWIPVLLHLCLDTCINAPVPGYLYCCTCAWIPVSTHLCLDGCWLQVAGLAHGLHQTIVKVEMCKTGDWLWRQNSRHLHTHTRTHVAGPRETVRAFNCHIQCFDAAGWTTRRIASQ